MVGQRKSVTTRERPHAALARTEKTSKSRSETSDYVYRPPVNSHFYYKILSPFCQWLVDNVFPDAFTPDLLTVTGFLAGVLATFATKYERFAVAGILWQLYCIFDNCDGKQARRLNLSSHGGEFMDHATDSVITSLAGFVMISACLDKSQDDQSKLFDQFALPFIIMVANFPYFFGIWGQAAYGQVIMGIERILQHILERLRARFFNWSPPESYGGDMSPEWISVDEYNFFLVPGLCFVRAYWQGFTSPLPSGQLADWCLEYLGLKITSPGILLVAFILAISVPGVIIMTLFLLSGRKGQFFVIPLALWAFIAIHWKLSFVVTGATFALLSFEVLVKQLKIHKHTSTYLLYPVLLQLIFIAESTHFWWLDDLPDLSPPCAHHQDVRAEMIIMISTAGILFTYKNVIHARNNEPNIPWIITKKQEIQEYVTDRLSEIRSLGWGLLSANSSCSNSKKRRASKMIHTSSTPDTKRKRSRPPANGRPKRT